MEYKNLLVKQDEGLVIVSINRPKVYNALNPEVLEEFEQLCSILEKDPAVRVVIFTGNSKVFAAGADLSDLMDADPLAAYDNCSQAHRTFDRIEALPFPTIAAINGMALGGGCELALSCDFRICGENALIGLPEVTLGIIPGAGGTQRLTNLVGPSRAKELVFLGTPVKAQKALEIGLANKMVADEEVMNEAEKMAKKLMERPKVALRFAKEAINCGVNTDCDTGKALEKARFSMIFSSRDQKEGMKAFFEKRKPNFTHE